MRLSQLGLSTTIWSIVPMMMMMMMMSVEQLVEILAG
jgi:hypothetical protein